MIVPKNRPLTKFVAPRATNSNRVHRDLRPKKADDSAAESRPANSSLTNNATANVTRMMRDTDLGGADFSITHHPASYNATGCQALCDSQAKCKAWVWADAAGVTRQLAAVVFDGVHWFYTMYVVPQSVWVQFLPRADNQIGMQELLAVPPR